jgi:hypothetical protein
MDNQLLLEISKIGFLIAGFWALIQFWSANEFKKSQFLSELWRKFYTTEKFVEIFALLDKEDSDLQMLNSISSKDVFSYLAFLEEIVIFRKTKFYEIHKIRDKNLIQLFQYHFYNIYEKDTNIRKLFWKKIEEELNTNEASWKFQKNFAIKCSKYIN